MAEPLSTLSPEKMNSQSVIRNDGLHSHSAHNEEGDISWHEAPSSPFLSNVELDNQENAPPTATKMAASTPTKDFLIDWDDDVPQSAFKAASPSKRLGLKEQQSPCQSPLKSPSKKSPAKSLLEGFEEDSFRNSGSRRNSKKASPVKQLMMERPGSAMSTRSPRGATSPAKSSHTPPVEPSEILLPDSNTNSIYDDALSPPATIRRTPAPRLDGELRDNEGLTVAIKHMEEVRYERHESYESPSTRHTGPGANVPDFEDDEMADLQRVESFGSAGSGPDGPELSSMDIDDTRFSTFSEMPNLDMTKFAFMRKSPTKNGSVDHQATPRASRAPQMTPTTARRRSDRTPSPTPRKHRRSNDYEEPNAGDTTNLLLDFTAQLQGFSDYARSTQSRRSPLKSGTEVNLRSYMQDQRSPAKASSQVPATPSRNGNLINLLDFELPPPPTPRSLPTVTIRELESLKSQFQSQISSLTASLSGKEAEVESLVKAVSDAERRVGEAHELARDERSAREHAEAQMVDWKNKGEEVQKLLQEVQSELARNDSERETFLARIAELEKRADDAEKRAQDFENRAIEAEGKNVDMTTFINPDDENKKIYSEADCKAAIQDRVKEVCLELHSAYKEKHEKKIKALKETYHNKAEAKCKELRTQVKVLERKLEKAQTGKDDTFSNIEVQSSPSKRPLPCEKCAQHTATNAELTQHLESHKSTIETLKCKLAGLESEVSSLRTSHDGLLADLESERIEKGELVAAAEQMLALCGEKMEELQQEEFRKSQRGPPPPRAPSRGPDPSMRSTGFLGGAPPPPRPTAGAMGGASERPRPSGGVPKPSGLRAPGGFGFGGGNAGGVSRSGSGSGKSRLMSNIERMGGRGD